MDHAVDVALEADEQTELGLVLDLALDLGAGRVLLGEGLPRVLQGLLETERDAALDRIDLQDLDLDLLGGGDDLAGWTFFLVQLISETWIRPSIPGSSSTKAP